MLCPSCHVLSPPGSCLDLRNEVFAYTLSLRDDYFLHQHAVDAYAAQHIFPDTKPVTIGASLLGLHLFVEHHYTGREVQRVHMLLGNKMKEWPIWPAPNQLATMTVVNVLKAPEGPTRDRAIRDWAQSVWQMWSERHRDIDRVLRSMYQPRIR
jgi:hypothetical protein